MRIGKALGKLPSGPPGYPPISAGAILAGSPAAGAYFPQFIASGGERMDDAVGTGAVLISRSDLVAPALAPFAAKLARWLEAHGAEAALLRPDRHVFGTGSPQALAAAWQAATGLEPPPLLA